VRSPAEIQFRLRQEFGNLAMFLSPPGLSVNPKAALTGRSPLLPDPALVAAALRDTGFAAQVTRIADQILEHRFPLLGLTIETGPAIDWRRDYLHGISTDTPYFRRSPYLDFSRAGDHKVVWELNRHQHLPLLAQAFLLTGKRIYLDEAFAQLADWLVANPFLRGINWASALEVAFRALSWAWLWQMAGSEMPDALRAGFWTALYRHGRFLELNLSVYFSPNTHLLGEAVALHALGVLFPTFPNAARWARIGGRIVEQEIQRQVREEGSHFEQSAYYHVYALDFFLLYRLFGAPPASYDERVVRMAEYLDALMGASGTLPLIGDDDGGRLFHPYGERVQFGRATMATCAVLFDRPEWLRDPADLCSQAAWWLGPPALAGRACASPPRTSRLFADAGTAVMTSGGAQLVIKAGPFGEGSGGHSHSDALSLTARLSGRDILIDPGSFTYIADPVERNRFRGSAAHNTVRIDGRDQAIPAGPFRWNEKPTVTIRQWTASDQQDYLDATCAYGGLVHRRRIVFLKPTLLVLLDTVDGPAGEHLLEQFWHLGALSDASRFSFSAPVQTLESWRSLALCSKEPAPLLSVALRTPLPAHMAMVLDLSDHPASSALEIRAAGDGVAVGRTPWAAPVYTF
jgi:Heparinase II/III-like protein/Heparinase II/III N-terminus